MVGFVPNLQSLVVDASIAVWAILPVLQARDVDAAGRFSAWGEQEVTLLAPAWWAAECTTAIRRTVFNKVITETRARSAISDLFALEVQIVPVDAALCESALEWAARLKQSRAYDSFYLALAQRLGINLWTADKRLANGAQQIGINWVRWIGDA
jgi:predicted nucleic acid-binding protein